MNYAGVYERILDYSINRAGLSESQKRLVRNLSTQILRQTGARISPGMNYVPENSLTQFLGVISEQIPTTPGERFTQIANLNRILLESNSKWVLIPYTNGQGGYGIASVKTT